MGFAMDPGAPRMTPRVSKLPFVKSAWLTFTGSLRCIALHATGQLTPEYGEEHLIRWWWQNVLESGRIHVRAEGQRLDPSQPYVLMSNHTSTLDIPVIFAAADPLKVRFIAKKDVGEIPFFGNALKRLDFVFIDRHHGQKAIRQLEKAKEVLSTGVSVWIAPEGARSRTAKLGPFKKGGFHLAVQLGVPIVPMWIEGASDIMPPDSLDCAYDGEVVVRFGEPIETEGCTRADVPRLLRETREAMLRLAQAPRALVDGGDQMQDSRSAPPLPPGFVRMTGAECAAEAARLLRQPKMPRF